MLCEGPCIGGAGVWAGCNGGHCKGQGDDEHHNPMPQSLPARTRALRLSPGPRWLWWPRGPGDPVPPAAPLTGAHVAAVSALPGVGIFSHGRAELVGPAGATGAAQQESPGPGGTTGLAATKGPRSVGCQPRHCAEPASTPWQLGLSCRHAPCARPGSAPREPPSLPKGGDKGIVSLLGLRGQGPPALTHSPPPAAVPLGTGTGWRRRSCAAGSGPRRPRPPPRQHPCGSRGALSPGAVGDTPPAPREAGGDRPEYRGGGGRQGGGY